MPRANISDSIHLGRLSADCSFMLTHLIRQNDDKTDEQAKDILCRILDLSNEPPNPLLKASESGWYSTAWASNIFNPITNIFDGESNSKAVCFTESTLSGLKAHRDVFNSKYGLAFSRQYLFNKNANPCLNIREDILKKDLLRTGEIYERYIYNFIPSELHPFVNIIHNRFDATHEREWRVPNDLSFNHKDILFLFCPESDFELFSVVQNKAKPLLFDLDWLDGI